MANYSIFSETLADMTWPQVEDAGRRHAPLLIPVAVIEQHSLHLPLATDTYAAHLQCVLIKKALASRAVEAVIAPPYFYGVNATTSMFPGSLTLEPETMAAALTETLRNYAGWGFCRQFVLNHHGDGAHVRAVVQAVRSLRKGGVDARLVVGGQALDWAGPVLKEDAAERGRDSAPGAGAVLRVSTSEATRAARARLTRSSLDVHAGERETSLILRFFPDTLDGGVDFRALEAVPGTMREFLKAEAAGGWRELSPHGHIGDPAVATRENGALYELEAADMAAAIAEALNAGA